MVVTILILWNRRKLRPVDLFDAGGGVKSYVDIQSVDPEDDVAFQRFSEDMLWSRVPTMVAWDPNSELARNFGMPSARLNSVLNSLRFQLGLDQWQLRAGRAV